MSEEQIKIWREEAMRLFSDSYLSSENITPIGYLKGFLAAKTSSYEREQKIITALKCCKNDYWFMTNLLEKYSTDKNEVIKNCIERMKFRKPIFEVIK